MNETRLTCLDPARRRDLILSGANGIDSVHVFRSDRKILRVVLFHPWRPDDRQALKDAVRYFSIEGGRRVCDLRVIGVEIPKNARPSDAYGVLDLTLNSAGDESPYVLRVVNPDKPSEPPESFDRQFSSAAFRFRPMLVSDRDCAPDVCPPSPSPPAPPIDYLAKDYASFRRLMLDRLAQTIPDWKERHVADLGITFVEALAYTADHLSYYQDSVATEAYLETARRRVSVRRHCRLVDYRMHEGSNARAWLHVEVDGLATSELPVEGLTFFTEPDGPTPQRTRQPITRKSDLEKLEEADRMVFEPVERVDSPGITQRLYPSHNEIRFYTWGNNECCLPKGTTSATLEFKTEWSRDQEPEPAPKVGDLLLFEEVKGPRTDLPADADPRHRHVVRLTRVERSIDRRPKQRGSGAAPEPQFQAVPVLSIGWDAADALPFALCISTRHHFNVSVARGNLVLVDHGLSIEQDSTDLAGLPSEETPEPSVCQADVPYLGADPPLARPRRFHTCKFPWELVRPLTHAAPFPDPGTQARTQARGLARWLLEVRDKRRRDLPTTPPYQQNLPPEPREDQGQRLIDPLQLVDNWVRRARAGQPVIAADAAQFLVLRSAWERNGPGRLELPDLLCPAQDDIRPDPRNAQPCLELAEVRPHNSAAPGAEPNSTGNVRAPIVWAGRADLLASGPEDRHFVLEIDDEGLVWLRFGDGCHGLSPAPATRFRLRYRLGNGQAGNVGAEAIRRVVGVNAPLIRSVRNPLAASGGVNPEPVATAKLLAPHAFRTEQLRAITASDYIRLAERDDRVQRAAATLAFTGAGYEAQVAVDVRAAALARTDDPAAEESLIRQEIEADLNHYRRIGHDVRVVPVHEVPLLVRLRICVKPHAQRGRVGTAVETILSNRDLPDGSRGFFHPDNFTFGQGIDLSRVVARVQELDDVAAVEVLEFRRMFGSSGHSLINGTLPMGPLEIARLDNDPVFKEHGELIIELEGGR